MRVPAEHESQKLKENFFSYVSSPILQQLILPALLLLAFVLRILALLDLKSTVYFDFLLWDERVYHIWATQIASGVYTPSAVYEFAPTPAYLIAFIYKVFSLDITYIRIFNVLIGVAVCFFGYMIGKELADRSTGILACLIAAVYEPFIFYSIVPLSAILGVFAFALVVYIFLLTVRQLSASKIFFLGAVVGLAPSIRGNFIILVPLTFSLVLLCQYAEEPSLTKLGIALVIYLLGFASTVAPFVIRNYSVTGELAWLPSQSGFNLYLSNNLENPDPYYRPVPFASSSPFEQGVQFTIEASRRAGRTLSAQEASLYWTHEVVKAALQHPRAFVWKTLQKTLALCNQFEPGDHYHIRFMSQFVPFFKFPFLRFSIIFPLAVAGIALTMKKSRKLWYACLLCTAYASTLILFFTNTRYRLPLLVVLIPFALIGVQHGFACLRGRRLDQAIWYLTLSGLFVIIEFLPVRGTDDLTAYYNTHAIILNAKGQETEAIKYWELSSQMHKPFSSFANLSLAGKYASKGEYATALLYLQKIPDGSFAAAFKYELLGDVLLKRGQGKDGIAAYQRSLAINIGRRELWRKLIRVLEKTDPPRASQAVKRLQYISSFYKGL
jgi:4-amino-4-deoxy-L-arabinose transferase-like glycosyltransferase